MIQNQVDVYVQRMLDASSTFYGYNAKTMLKSEKGWMVMTRTYPRVPFWEEINESKPQWTRSGRFENYRVEPEAIEYGENFIVHREGPEGTPYLPNAIFRPTRTFGRMTTGFRSRRSIMTTSTCAILKLPWQEIRRTCQPVVGEGVSVLLRDPEDPAPGAQPVVGQRLDADVSSRTSAIAYRMDKRTPGVGEHQMHVNPRPRRTGASTTATTSMWTPIRSTGRIAGWKPSDPFYKVSRLMIRASTIRRSRTT